MDTRAYGNSLGIYLTTLCVEAMTGAFRALIFSLLSLPFGLLLAFIYVLLFSPLTQGGLYGAFAAGEGFVLVIFAIVGGALVLGGFLAFIPLGLSLLSYWGAGGGYAFTRFALGARPPSTRELERVQEELVDIQEGLEREVLSFSRILILDAPLTRIYTVGTTLYISSAAVRTSNHLGALLAHELGHLNHGDSGLVLSLRRLVFPLFYLFMGKVTDYSTDRPNSNPTPTGGQSPSNVYYSLVNAIIFFVLAVVGGGFGVWLCSFWWADYFRKRDFLADQFVVECGLDDQLIEFLEQNLFYDTSVPYLLGWQPANELRLDRLLNPDAAGLPHGTAQWSESLGQKYGSVLLLAFVVAVIFTFFVPLGALSFWFSFIFLFVLGLYFRGSVQDLHTLADRLFAGRTQTQAYVRMIALALLIALLLNFLTGSLTWGFFWFVFILAASSLYALRWTVLEIHDIGAVMRAFYGQVTHYYRQLNSNNSSGQRSGGSARQTHFQRRILEEADQQGPDALSLYDVRRLLVEIMNRFRGVDMAIIQNEIGRLVNREYVTLRDDVLDDLEALLADTTLATPRDVILWLDRRITQS